MSSVSIKNPNSENSACLMVEEKPFFSAKTIKFESTFEIHQNLKFSMLLKSS